MAAKTKNQDLYGMFEASMDRKTGRFVIPADVYEYLHKNVRLTVDPLGRFLEVRSEENFELLVERITAAESTLPVEVIAALRVDYLGFSAEGQIDGSLRLVVPKRMREVLGEDDDLILIGVKDFLQVWPASKYREDRAARMKAFATQYSQVQHLIMGISRPEPAPAPVPPVSMMIDAALSGQNGGNG